MSDDALTRHARNWDALCLYGWEPYMHNPRLKRWLGRSRLPTLVLWGASRRRRDSRNTAARYAALIPGARFALDRRCRTSPGDRAADALADHILELPRPLTDRQL